MRRLLALFPLLGLFIAAPAGAVTLTHAGNAYCSASAASCVASSVTVPSGALIVVAVDGPITASTSLAVTDSASNTYHLAQFCYPSGVNTHHSFALFYAYNATALAAGTVTITYGSSDTGGLDVSYATGMNTTSAVLDGASCGVSDGGVGGTQLDSGIITPTQGGDLFVGFGGNRGQSFTQDSNFATPPNNIDGGVAGNNDIGGNLTEPGFLGHAYRPVMGASNDWAAIEAAFKVATPTSGQVTTQVGFMGFGAGSNPVRGCNGAPAIACGAGLTTKTASYTSWTTSTVDSAATGNAGFQWYFGADSGGGGTITLNTTNVVVGQATGGGNMTLATATTHASTWHGTAFGGPAYFVVTGSFTPCTSSCSGSNWPAWWTWPLEKIQANQAGFTTQCPALTARGAAWACWSNQSSAGYLHHAENDIMEEGIGGATTCSDQATNHDWHGVSDASQTTQWFIWWPTAGCTFFSSSHTYGLLWIPATATTQGRLCYDVDGVGIGCTYYSQFLDSMSPPPSWGGAVPAGGVTDYQHLFVAMGSTNANPLTTTEVDVWQATAANNLTN